MNTKQVESLSPSDLVPVQVRPTHMIHHILVQIQFEEVIDRETEEERERERERASSTLPSFDLLNGVLASLQVGCVARGNGTRGG